MNEPPHDGQTKLILRLSQKLCTRIRAGSLQPMPLDENPFADWSAQLLRMDRTQYVIVSNTKSLYSILFYVTSISNESKSIVRGLGAIREFMEDDGHALACHCFIVPDTGRGSFTKAIDRSVTGSVNELIRSATAWLEDVELSPHELGSKLNEGKRRIAGA